MCSNCPGIKLEPALGTKEDKIGHLLSYAHVVHTKGSLTFDDDNVNDDATNQ